MDDLQCKFTKLKTLSNVFWLPFKKMSSWNILLQKLFIHQHNSKTRNSVMQANFAFLCFRVWNAANHMVGWVCKLENRSNLNSSTVSWVNVFFLLVAAAVTLGVEWSVWQKMKNVWTPPEAGISMDHTDLLSFCIISWNALQILQILGFTPE